eukprot:scaffold24408_cov101-Isochrysis_galbana.AAC.3
MSLNVVNDIKNKSKRWERRSLSEAEKKEKNGGRNGGLNGRLCHGMAPHWKLEGALGMQEGSTLRGKNRLFEKPTRVWRKAWLPAVLIGRLRRRA